MNIAVLCQIPAYFLQFAEANNMRIKRTRLQAEDKNGNVYIYCNCKERMYGIEFGKLHVIGSVPKELTDFANPMVR